jgi:hypothetical protein
VSLSKISKYGEEDILLISDILPNLMLELESDAMIHTKNSLSLAPIGQFP